MGIDCHVGRGKHHSLRSGQSIAGWRYSFAAQSAPRRSEPVICFCHGWEVPERQGESNM
jgi:hypothetical protein